MNRRLITTTGTGPTLSPGESSVLNRHIPPVPAEVVRPALLVPQLAFFLCWMVDPADRAATALLGERPEEPMLVPLGAGPGMLKTGGWQGTLRFPPQLEMRPSSNAPSPVESREAPPTSSFPGFSEPP